MLCMSQNISLMLFTVPYIASFVVIHEVFHCSYPYLVGAQFSVHEMGGAHISDDKMILL